jgi:hypothetical protein
MSVFTLTNENELFLKNPSMEACKARIGDAPYWTIQDRICYHNHSEPLYIIHHNIPVEAVDAKEWYKDFFHVFPNKKTLYAMSHYSLSELKELAICLEIPVDGIKKVIYERIQIKLKRILL